MITFQTVSEVQAYVREQAIQFISFYVSDIDGRLRNVTIPAQNFSQRIIEEGIGFDASNLGFAAIHSSDMILKPDLNCGFKDPVETEVPVLYFLCYMLETHNRSNFDQDLRHMVQKALRAFMEEGVIDEIHIGLELEFNILDELYSRMTPREVSYRLHSSEFASPSSGEEIYRIATNRGYFRSEPNDHLFKIRNEIVNAIESLGFGVKYHHHEVGSSQCEIEFKFASVDEMADATVLAKNICHRVARKYGKIATFLPKIIPGEAGNGMHIHQFGLKNGKNVFHDPKGLYQLSDIALYYIGGILFHSSSLLAITNPTTNSYRRLIPGFEAPVNAVFAEANRSAAIRIPGYIQNDQERRFEFRTIDATCNPYLAYSAMLMAGLDGIRRKIDPREHGFGPYESNLYQLSPQELSKIKAFPASLEDALNALREDYEYLTWQNVFAKPLIEKWIEVKQKDINEMRRIPHPWEVARYYDL